MSLGWDRSEQRVGANLPLKESDRRSVLAIELGRLGARVEEREDGLSTEPARLEGARIGTYRDHRIATSFAAAALVVRGTTIADQGCVANSFPGFWTASCGLAGNAA